MTTFPPLYNKSNDQKIEARLDEILNGLYNFHGKDIDLGLKRIERFLHQLGDPHLELPAVIHVAGTNGKGSTIACLRAVLEGTGHVVHVITSPHLVHPTERIILAGQPISTEAFIDVLEECLKINRNDPITFFEMLIAASFLAMSRVNADYVLMETGMGGRLDATNVIAKPICTIITTISKDHSEFLGDTIDLIAVEKAGIMKSGVPCIVGKQIYTEANKVFHRISQELPTEAPLYQHGAEWNIEPNPDGFKFTWQGESIAVSHANLLGSHQIYNIGAALGAYRIIMGERFDAKILSPDAPIKPLLKINWPGRLQELKNHPFTDLIPDANKNNGKNNCEIFIDGGHNDSAGMMLAEQAKIWRVQDNKKLHLVVAMVDRKDPAAFLAPLVPYTDSITITTIPNEASSYSIDKLEELIRPLGFKNLKKAPDPEAAVQNLSSEMNNRILITGSLYLMGHILSL